MNDWLNPEMLYGIIERDDIIVPEEEKELCIKLISIFGNETDPFVKLALLTTT